MSALIAQRQERVFLILAGVFLGTLVMINILGLTRFIQWEFSIGRFSLPLVLPLGVLPYPITFLCTDIISEFYGKQRANCVVWIGLLINLWILFIVWIGGHLPPAISLDPLTQLPPTTHSDYAFFQIRLFTLNGVIGSMIAYLSAQLLDVHLFHFWKDFTHGKHLWLRNNASTLVSQFVDTVIVISIAYWFTQALPMNPNKSISSQLLTLIFSSYGFKALAALLDTLPFYLAVYGLRRYFGLPGNPSTTLPLFHSSSA